MDLDDVDLPPNETTGHKRLRDEDSEPEESLHQTKRQKDASEEQDQDVKEIDNVTSDGPSLASFILEKRKIFSMPQKYTEKQRHTRAVINCTQNIQLSKDLLNEPNASFFPVIHVSPSLPPKGPAVDQDLSGIQMVHTEKLSTFLNDGEFPSGSVLILEESPDLPFSKHFKLSPTAKAVSNLLSNRRISMCVLMLDKSKDKERLQKVCFDEICSTFNDHGFLVLSNDNEVLQNDLFIFKTHKYDVYELSKHFSEILSKRDHSSDALNDLIGTHLTPDHKQDVIDFVRLMAQKGRSDESILLALHEHFNDLVSSGLIPDENWRTNTDSEDDTPICTKQVLSILPPAFKPRNLLHIGCGNGVSTDYLGKVFSLDPKDVFGCDVRPLPPSLDKKLFQFSCLSSSKKSPRSLDVYTSPSSALSSPSKIPLSASLRKLYKEIKKGDTNGFDLIVLDLALHHARKHQKLLTSVHRLLSEGGMLLVREHDQKDEDTKGLLHILHAMHSRVWTSPPEICPFFGNFKATFLARSQWQEIISVAGFEHTSPQDPDSSSSGPYSTFLDIFKKLPIERPHKKERSPEESARRSLSNSKLDQEQEGSGRPLSRSNQRESRIYYNKNSGTSIDRTRGGPENPAAIMINIERLFQEDRQIHGEPPVARNLCDMFSLRSSNSNSSPHLSSSSSSQFLSASRSSSQDSTAYSYFQTEEDHQKGIRRSGDSSSRFERSQGPQNSKPFQQRGHLSKSGETKEMRLDPDDGFHNFSASGQFIPPLSLSNSQTSVESSKYSNSLDQSTDLPSTLPTQSRSQNLFSSLLEKQRHLVKPSQQVRKAIQRPVPSPTVTRSRVSPTVTSVSAMTQSKSVQQSVLEDEDEDEEFEDYGFSPKKPAVRSPFGAFRQIEDERINERPLMQHSQMQSSSKTMSTSQTQSFVVQNTFAPKRSSESLTYNPFDHQDQMHSPVKPSLATARSTVTQMTVSSSRRAEEEEEVYVSGPSVPLSVRSLPKNYLSKPVSSVPERFEDDVEEEEFYDPIGDFQGQNQRRGEWRSPGRNYSPNEPRNAQGYRYFNNCRFPNQHQEIEAVPKSQRLRGSQNQDDDYYDQYSTNHEMIQTNSSFNNGKSRGFGPVSGSAHHQGHHNTFSDHKQPPPFYSHTQHSYSHQQHQQPQPYS